MVTEAARYYKQQVDLSECLSAESLFRISLVQDENVMARWILATGGFYLQGLPAAADDDFGLSYSRGSWADWKQR